MEERVGVWSTSTNRRELLKVRGLLKPQHCWPTRGCKGFSPPLPPISFPPPGRGRGMPLVVVGDCMASSRRSLGQACKSTLSREGPFNLRPRLLWQVSHTRGGGRVVVGSHRCGLFLNPENRMERLSWSQVCCRKND